MCGHLGQHAQSVAKTMIEHQLIHFIASDAHNVTNRKFYMKDGYDWIVENISKEVADRLVMNAERLLNGEEIKYISPMTVEKQNIDQNQKRKKKKKKFFGLF